MKLFGGIFGAMIGAGLVLGPSRTVRLHSDPPMIDRPMVMAIATIVAMVAGAVIGARTAARYSEDDEDAQEALEAPSLPGAPGPPGPPDASGAPGALRAPRAPGTAGVRSILRTLRFPITIVCLLVPLTALVDAIEPRPVNARGRATWARKVLAHNAEYPRAFPRRAEEMASRVQGCIGTYVWFDADVLINTPGCANLAAMQFGLSPDSLAMLGAYRPGDQGWRWQIIEDSDPTRVAILPEPLLRVEGPIPVYELMNGATYRRDDRGEPAYALDSTLIRAAHAYDCLVASTLELRSTGRWDGNGETLPAARPRRGARAGRGLCRAQ